MKNFLNCAIYILSLPLKILFILLIYFYKYILSPILPHVCKFYPTCSQYFLQAVIDYGAIKGFLIGIKRFLKCNPWSDGGYDPLKPNIKGNIKWIL